MSQEGQRTMEKVLENTVHDTRMVNKNTKKCVERALPNKCKMTFGASRWDALKVDKFCRNFGSTD